MRCSWSKETICRLAAFFKDQRAFVAWFVREHGLVPEIWRELPEDMRRQHEALSSTDLLTIAELNEAGYAFTPVRWCCLCSKPYDARAPETYATRCLVYSSNGEWGGALAVCPIISSFRAEPKYIHRERCEQVLEARLELLCTGGWPHIPFGATASYFVFDDIAGLPK